MLGLCFVFVMFEDVLVTLCEAKNEFPRVANKDF